MANPKTVRYGCGMGGEEFRREFPDEIDTFLMYKGPFGHGVIIDLLMHDCGKLEFTTDVYGVR